MERWRIKLIIIITIIIIIIVAIVIAVMITLITSMNIKITTGRKAVSRSKI